MSSDYKNSRLVMVVEREKLFSVRYFEGFLSIDEFDYEPVILNNYEYRTRKEVEKDEKFKQPISYALIINRRLRKVFSHFRNGGDSRLEGFWTPGIMEHIEPKDEIIGNPLYNGCVRGIEEETNLDNAKPNLVGYVNVDEGKVNKVHFGLVYVVETNLDEITLTDEKLKDGKFRSVSELRELHKLEFWIPHCFDVLDLCLNSRL